MSAAGDDPSFLTALHGSFLGLLRFEHFEALCEKLRSDVTPVWHAYTIGVPPPAGPLSPEILGKFLDSLQSRLRPDAVQGRCGFVYVDDAENPTFVKIYDPKRLGACGISRTPPQPAWVLSKLKPSDITSPPVQSRWRRFRLF
jgi:hypothetical protein